MASELVQSGESLYVVQAVLGQSDHRMAQRYSHLAANNLKTAMEKLAVNRQGARTSGA